MNEPTKKIYHFISTLYHEENKSPLDGENILPSFNQLLNVADISARQLSYQLFSEILLQKPTENIMKKWMDNLPLLRIYFSKIEEQEITQWISQFEQSLKIKIKYQNDFNDLYDIYLAPLGFKLEHMSNLALKETYSSMKTRQLLQLEALDLIEDFLIPFLESHKQKQFHDMNGTIYYIFFEILYNFVIWDYQILLENKLD